MERFIDDWKFKAWAQPVASRMETGEKGFKHERTSHLNNYSNNSFGLAASLNAFQEFSQR